MEVIHDHRVLNHQIDDPVFSTALDTYFTI